MSAASVKLRDRLSESPDSTAPATGAMHHHFMQFESRIRVHAEIAARRYRCPGKREDFVAEVLAVAWKWYVRCVEQGKDVSEFVSTLATFAVKHVRSGRRLCGSLPAKDAMSEVAHFRHGFTVQGLPSGIVAHERLSAPHGQREQDVLEEALRDNTVTPPPDQAAFRCDYPEWMSSYDQRRRDIAEAMIRGESTTEIAEEFGVSLGRVSQLRRAFCEEWAKFHGE